MYYLDVRIFTGVDIGAVWRPSSLVTYVTQVGAQRPRSELW
jgi:hypothetical protein